MPSASSFDALIQVRITASRACTERWFPTPDELVSDAWEPPFDLADPAGIRWRGMHVETPAPTSSAAHRPQSGVHRSPGTVNERRLFVLGTREAPLWPLPHPAQASKRHHTIQRVSDCSVRDRRPAMSGTHLLDGSAVPVISFKSYGFGSPAVRQHHRVIDGTRYVSTGSARTSGAQRVHRHGGRCSAPHRYHPVLAERRGTAGRWPAHEHHHGPAWDHDPASAPSGLTAIRVLLPACASDRYR